MYPFQKYGIANLACTISQPFLGIWVIYSPTYLHTTWVVRPIKDVNEKHVQRATLTRPCSKCFFGSIFVTRTEFDNMTTPKVVFAIQLREMCWWFSVIWLGWGVTDGVVESWVYLAMKFVCNPFGLSDRVPPTICFTLPSWRSIQGRNWLRRRVVDVEVIALLWTRASGKGTHPIPEP